MWQGARRRLLIGGALLLTCAFALWMAVPRATSMTDSLAVTPRAAAAQIASQQAAAPAAAGQQAPATGQGAGQQAPAGDQGGDQSGNQAASPTTSADPEKYPRPGQATPANVATWFKESAPELAKALLAFVPGAEGSAAESHSIQVGEVRQVNVWSAEYLRGTDLNTLSVPVYQWVAPVTIDRIPTGVVIYTQSDAALVPPGFKAPRATSTRPVASLTAAPSPTTTTEVSEPEQARGPLQINGLGGVYVLPGLAAALSNFRTYTDPAVPVWDAQAAGWFVLFGQVVVPVTRGADQVMAGDAPASQVLWALQSWWEVGPATSSPEPQVVDTATPLTDIFLIIVLALVVVGVVGLLVIRPLLRHEADNEDVEPLPDPALIWLTRPGRD